MKLNTRSPFYRQYTKSITIDSDYGDVINDTIPVSGLTVDNTEDENRVSNNYINLSNANTE